MYNMSNKAFTKICFQNNDNKLLLVTAIVAIDILTNQKL